MGKIKDWLIQLLGGYTKYEYEDMVKRKEHYQKLFKLNADCYSYEHSAKCAAINQARKWKKKYDDLVKANEQNYKEEHKHQVKYNKLNDLYGQVMTRAMSLQARCITLSKSIVMIDGIPQEYIKKQMSERFAAELGQYITYTTSKIYDSLTLKTQTNVVGSLEVVKPNE